MWHLNLYTPERHRLLLAAVSEQTGLTMSELIRRMLDYNLRPCVLNEMLPSMSGQIQVDVRG